MTPAYRETSCAEVSTDSSRPGTIFVRDRGEKHTAHCLLSLHAAARAFVGGLPLRARGFPHSKGVPNAPAADERDVELFLVKLAQLVAGFSEIREIDLNPVLADETGVLAVDARVSIAPVEKLRRGPSSHPRFAIRPYPKEWEQQATLQDGTAILLRPICRELGFKIPDDPDQPEICLVKLAL
jgi:hypothetical protein